MPPSTADIAQFVHGIRILAICSCGGIYLSMVPRLRRGRLAGRALRTPFYLARSKPGLPVRRKPPLPRHQTTEGTTTHGSVPRSSHRFHHGARARGDVYRVCSKRVCARSLARTRTRVRERPSTYVGEAASIVSSRKSRLHAGDDSLHKAQVLGMNETNNTSEPESDFFSHFTFSFHC